MSAELRALCSAHGIEPAYVGIDGRKHAVPTPTLEALAAAFGLERSAAAPPDGIAEALAEPSPSTCYIPPALRRARVWGLTCQVPALRSKRSLGVGDFADLAEFCRIAAAEGADFVGVNPLHALFTADPSRISPFSPSDRRLLNPLYLAPEWIDVREPAATDLADAKPLNAQALIDYPATWRLKDRVLRRLFAGHGTSDLASPEFAAFRRRLGAPLGDDALFEALSGVMAIEGHGAGWTTWPSPFRDRRSPEVNAFADPHRAEIDYRLWLQFHADRQFARVQNVAQKAGMRIGLYVDFAVGAAPDGAATWGNPMLTAPGLSIGAPPDAFSENGQDWGLAPLSPVRLAEDGGRALAELLQAAIRHAGAVRIDHAMSLARLWLIPHGVPATKGAYVRYPLKMMLDRVADASNNRKAIVIGEDLGVVPEGFRQLMAARALHAYKVWFFDRAPGRLPRIGAWDRTALACIGTHDTCTFAGWWSGHDLETLRAVGLISADRLELLRKDRAADRAGVAEALQRPGTAQAASLAAHAGLARSRCRLAALQVEDALGLRDQVNVPGTTTEHPNWRRRLPVALEDLTRHTGFAEHCALMRSKRPK